MPRRRRYSVSATPALVGDEMSSTERFVHSRLALYAIRLLSKHHRLFGKDFLEFCWFVLGPRFVREAVEYFYPGEGVRRRRGESYDLDEIVEDGYDFAGAVLEWSQEYGASKAELVSYFRKSLKKRLDELQSSLNFPIERRFQEFARMFQLTDAETLLCEFLFLQETWEEAEDFFRHLNVTQYRSRHLLSCMLGLSQTELNETLTGTLSKIGLLENNRHGGISLENDVFCSFLSGSSDSTEIKNPWCRKLDKTPIPLEHHFLDPAVLEHVLSLMQTKTEGSSTNLLILGPPGCGKTEFCLGIAGELESPIYEVKVGENSKPKERLTATWAAVNMHGNEGIILVDDADRLLNATAFSFFSDGIDKRAVHDLLEDPSGARVIWVVNDVWFGASIMRRFSFALRFGPFKRKQRIRFWKNVLSKHHAESLMDEKTIVKVAARYEEVSPGVIDGAVQKAAAIASSPKLFEKAVALGIEAHEELLTGKKPRHKDSINMDEVSLEGLNLEGDDVSTVLKHVEAYDRLLGGAA